MKTPYFDIPPELQRLDDEIMEQCADSFRSAEEIRDHNQLKVLEAFTSLKVASPHLGGSTGYGYGDAGRDKIDEVFARITGSESALFRYQFASGTHALTVALFALLRPGDLMLCVTGEPYDTLRGVISGGGGSLEEFGVRYEQIELLDGKPDLKEIALRSPDAKIVYVQRSRGYSLRNALSLEDVEEISLAAKRANPDALVLADNCYCEFTRKKEPTEAGADLIVGSLLKNAGGGIAETGGYAAGKKELMKLCAKRLTAPSLGAEVGCNPAGLRNLYLGLYFAPHTVCEAKKSAAYAAALFEKLGFETIPKANEACDDIVTSVILGDKGKLAAVCGAIQSRSPVDSFAAPEGAPMPGYDCDVIMASGSFTGGSSIELSCDAPLREPYAAYIQGGLNLTASRAALLEAAKRIRSLL